MTLKTRSRHPRQPAQAYRALAVAQLQRVVGVGDCDPALLLHWAESGELLHLARGSLVCRRGDVCRGLAVVLSGAVAVGRQLGGRDAHVYTYLGPGDLHGFIPVADGGPYTHDLVAHEDTVLLVVPATLVQATLQRQPSLRQAFMLQMAHRARVAHDRVYEGARLPLACRLARQLAFLGRTFGTQRPDGLILSVRMSQADLAAALGAGRQQVNTELKKLTQRGVIRVSRAAITLLDTAALETSALNLPPAALTLRRPAEPQPAAELRGTHLLVVDDDEVYRLLLSTWLQQAGAHVVQADNGVIAVERAQSTALAFDAILMDDKMPVLSGAEAARRIRAHEAASGKPPTPILCISSASARRDAERYRAAGMDGLVPKPAEPTPLLEALRPLLR